MSRIAIAARIAMIAVPLTLGVVASTHASAVTIGPAPITLPATKPPAIHVPVYYTLLIKSSGGIPSGGGYYPRQCAAGEKEGSIKVVVMG